jgi:hypothetical protein
MALNPSTRSFLNLFVFVPAICLQACSAGTSRSIRTEAAVRLACGAPLSGANDVLKPYATVILGEFHGTSEVPQLVSRLVCQASTIGLKVRLGLEIPREEQGVIEALLRSKDVEAATTSLLQGSFWTRDFQDGRSSEAMLALLLRLREFIQSGANITVFSYDDSTAGSDRDAAMAKNIRSATERTPDSFNIVLTGNVHAKLTRGAPWSADFVPMGWHLVEATREIISLNVRYSGGSAWACMGPAAGDCAAQEMQGKDEGPAPFVRLLGTRESGYDGVFYVGAITAARPAASAKTLKASSDGSMRAP